MFINFWQRKRARERERQHEQRRGRERGRHRIRSRLQALSCQYRAWLGAQTHRPWDHDQSRNRTPNRLSHPGAPAYFSDSAHWIYPATAFWPAKFLWVGLLQTWSVFPFTLGNFFFPLAAFMILSLPEYFVNLTMICLVDGQFLWNLMGVLCASWILTSVSFPSFRTCFPLWFAHITLMPLSLSRPLLGPLWFWCCSFLMSHWFSNA